MKLSFYIPTQVVLEDGCVRKHAALLAPLGKHALVVTGRTSAKKCGALADVQAALAENGQEMTLFDRVMANPTVECVYAGAEALRAAGADFVVAIGGGSPMDAAKVIAMLAAEQRPVEALFSGGYEKRVPLCCIPTTAGTGSEVTKAAILTNDAAQTKTALSAPALFPDLALLDARYLYALNHTTMVNTVIDSLSHSVEGYLSAHANPVSDLLALEAVGIVGGLLTPLGKDELTPEQKEKLLYASTLGGMVIAHTGTTAVHAMGYSLTYFKHIDHGRANGLLLRVFLDWMERAEPRRVQTLLRAMGFADTAQLGTALDALLGAPEEVSASECGQYAGIAIRAGNIANCLVVPTQEELLRLYLAAFRPES